MYKYIYEPKGKAGEYGKYALNLYNGCTHGCRYCYVPAIKRQTPEQYHARAERRNMKWTDITKEIKEHSGKDLFLCFTCDPYQPIDVDFPLTRHIVSECHDNNVRTIILTKGGKRSERDFDLLAKRPDLSLYGATLTFTDESDSGRWEPHAAPPTERFDALKKAHTAGIPTWASLEPVIDPAQSLEIIRMTREYVDEFKVGKWNHDAAAKEIDWKSFARAAVSLLSDKKYYIKKDLAVYL